MIEPFGVPMEWLMEDAIDARAGLSLARITVAPGVTSPAHRHPDCVETVHVLSGRAEQRRDEAWLPLAAGPLDPLRRSSPDPQSQRRSRRSDRRLLQRRPRILA